MCEALRVDWRAGDRVTAVRDGDRDLDLAVGDRDRDRVLARPALPRLSVKSRCSSNVLSLAPRGMVFLRSGEFVSDLLKVHPDLDRC
jgi:hypothetical protein